MYQKKSCKITDIHVGDNGFDKERLKEDLYPTNLHIYTKNEHVAIIEMPTYTVKEQSKKALSLITTIQKVS